MSMEKCSSLPITTSPHVGKAPQQATRRSRITGTILSILCGCWLGWWLGNRLIGPAVIRIRLGIHGQGSSWRNEQARREALFLSTPTPQSAHAASLAYASVPHLAGSTEDYASALRILGFFQSELNITASGNNTDVVFQAGSDVSRASIYNLTNGAAGKTGGEAKAWVDVYYPVMNTPVNHSLAILGGDTDSAPIWQAPLEEVGDPLDETAFKYATAVTTWHGFSADGDASGTLVFADYGRIEDYEKLTAAGVSLKGKIVLVRYGGVFRGLKIKAAEELGAVAVIIYSDPRDDGFVTVENGFAVYPHGPARNPTSVQRGSVQYLSLYPGDPTTPGYPAYENATRADGTNVPKIPSLPVSWANAQRLLEEIAGTHAFDGQDLSALVGSESTRVVRLVNHVDTKVTPIWNTVAAIPGHMQDEVVVVGCHRDAWVMGAADPISGTASLHEVVRGLGALLKTGWKPLRTILIVSWDAEEYGLVGSTEWGEDFASWLADHAVSYINVDVSVSGSQWGASGSPLLAHLVKDAALDVPHPSDETRTLWDAQQDQGPFFGPERRVDEEVVSAWRRKQEMREDGTAIIGALGSGSDYTVFLQRLGIPSTDQGFSGTPSDAVYHYHSIYDSVRWEEVYADPDFSKHVAVAKHLGLQLLRLTDSIILPLNTTQYSLELDTYLDNVIAVVPPTLKPVPDFSALRKSIHKLQHASEKLDNEKEHAEIAFLKALHDLEKSRRRHSWCARFKNWVKGVFDAPRVDYARRTVGKCGAARRSWEEELERMLADDDHVVFGHPHGHRRDKYLERFIKAAKHVRAVNQKLIGYERGFISKEGIPDREWYRHLGVAPGKWLGYGATTFPALTESLTIAHNTTLAQHEASRLVDVLDKIAKSLQK